MKEISKLERRGLIPGIAHLALEVVDKTQRTALGMLQDTRGEVRVLVESGIELSEKAAMSLFRIMRKVTQRFDDAVAETLTATERLSSSAVETAREATRGAVDLAATTIDGVVGNAVPRTMQPAS